MDILPSRIKKVLPTYLVIEFVFIGFLVFSFLIPYALIIQRDTFRTANFIIVLTPTESSFRGYVLELISVYKTKRVYLQYYGQNFDIQTDVKTFSELAPLLPLDIKKDYVRELAPLELSNRMNITIPPNQYQAGIASWYGAYFQGRPTASTEPYNMYALTAAHKILPPGTKVKVTNVENRKSIIVRINDRGPCVGERIIDLSFESARQLGVVDHGLAAVILEIVE